MWIWDWWWEGIGGRASLQKAGETCEGLGVEEELNLHFSSRAENSLQVRSLIMNE